MSFLQAYVLVAGIAAAALFAVGWQTIWNPENQVSPNLFTFAEKQPDLAREFIGVFLALLCVIAAAAWPLSLLAFVVFHFYFRRVVLQIHRKNCHEEDE